MTRSILFAYLTIALAADAAFAGYGALPLSFAENQGQAPPGARFVAQGPGYRVLLSANSAEIGAGGSAIRMTLLGAASSPRIEGTQPLWPVHYLVGRDPSRWRTNVRTYGRVLYPSVYPGIDLLFYGNERRLEYGFTVGPGADPQAIRLEIEGSKNVSVGPNGDLLLGPQRFRKPLAYQTRDGARREVSCAYRVHGRRVSFRTGAYDRTRPLVIDPVFVYSTYLGGSGHDQAQSIAIDRDGNAYIAGTTDSTDFPTTPGVVQPRPGSQSYSHAFIAKLNPAGTALVYATYLGGTNNDNAARIAVNDQGSVYVLGWTNSSDFPVVNPLFQPSSSQYFLAKLSPDGSHLLFSTLMPDGASQVRDLALDPDGNVWLTGAATANWPRVNALQEYVPPANFYKSTDRGATWQPLSAVPAELPYIVAVAVDPKSPLNLYAATYTWATSPTTSPQTRVYRSTDGGLTWTPSATTLPGVPARPGASAPIAFDPISPSTLYFGTGAGLFRSTDSGQTWRQASPSLVVTSIAVNPQTTSTLYIGTGDPQAPGAAYRSTDGGANWTAAGISATVVAVDPRTPATVYAAGLSKIYKSTDAGVTWKLSNSGITANAVIRALAIDPVASNVLYAAGTGRPNLVHKSIDGGATWQSAVGGLLLGEVTTVVLNPLMPSELFAAAWDGISVTTDGAATWAPVARQLPTASPSLAIDPSTGAFYAPLANAQPYAPAPFITKINASGSAVLFSTPLGGSWEDWAQAIAVDRAGRAYVAGSATSPDFPLVNPMQPNKVGQRVGFLTVLAADGSAVLSSTYLDGPVWALGLDAGSRAYLLGSSSSRSIFGPSRSVISSVDPFVPALLYTASPLAYAGHLAVDRAGNAYLAGTCSGASCGSASPIAQITKLDPTGAAVVSFYLGYQGALAADDSGGVYLAGFAYAQDFPAINALQPALSGPQDAFVAKIDTNAQSPQPSLQSVVGAANYRPEAIAPGSLVALFGAGLASGVAQASAIPLPSAMIDAVVTFNGLQAPLLYVSPNQINAQVPWEVAPGAVTVSVVRWGRSASLTATVAEAGPGIFTRNALGTGPGAILHASDLSPVSDASPAHPGETLAVYCTGLGRMRTPIMTGYDPPTAPTETVFRPEVRIAGRSAIVTFSGAAPRLVGMNQVNIEVPPDTPAGLQPLVLSINGVESNTVQVAVR